MAVHHGFLLALSAVAYCKAEYFNTTRFTGLLLGDWGGINTAPYTEPGQTACAVGMGIVAEQDAANIGLLLGDNFYEYGLHGDAHSSRFDETFENVYTAPSLQQMPFYVVAGNHDYLGNVTAQVEYSKLNPRWNFPSLYYTKTFEWSDGHDGTVAMDIVFIDTVVLAGNSHDAEDEFGPLPGPADAELAQYQWDYIETALANSTADYLFTAGHYPVWSGCQHGPTFQLVHKLKPLLETHNATGHLAGHDHCLMYIDEGKGPVYPVTGAGDNCCYHNKHEQSCPEDSILYHAWNDGSGSPIVGGFGSFVATAANLTFRMHAANGTVLYTAEPVLPRSFD